MVEENIMAKNIDISLPFTNLSVEILKRYLEGKLSKQERIEVEKQLKEDPLAADALEGLRALENHDLLLTLAPAMERDTRQMLARKRHKKLIGLSIRHYVMAAAVIVVIWLSFSIFKDIGSHNAEKTIATTAADSQPIAQVQESKPEISPSKDETSLSPSEKTLENPSLSPINPTEEKAKIITESPVSPEKKEDLNEEKEAIADNKNLRNEVESPKEEVKTSNKPAVTATSPAANVKGGSAEPAKDVAVSTKGGSVAPAPSPTPTAMPSQNYPSPSKSVGKTASVPGAPRSQKENEAKMDADDLAAEEAETYNELQASDVNMSAGMDDYNAGDYAKAGETFKKIPANSIFYAESRLRLGQSQAALGQYPQAINTLKGVSRKSPFHFEAQWELAQTYLKKGDKEKARKVLAQLSKEKNPYQNQASQKLEEVK